MLGKFYFQHHNALGQSLPGGLPFIKSLAYYIYIGSSISGLTNYWSLTKWVKKTRTQALAPATALHSGP